MRITITIGDQRLTVVAQGDEYEIVLPERIEHKFPAQRETSPTLAPKATSSVERDSFTPSLPVENTEEVQQILNPEILRVYGVSLQLLARTYDYVKKHDLCRFGEVCTSLGYKRHSLIVKRALKILRVIGSVFKDGRERYSTRRVLPSCSSELLERVAEIVETLPGITLREIAELLGHKGSDGAVSEAVLYLAGIRRIRAIPEVRGITVIWRHYPAK